MNTFTERLKQFIASNCRNDSEFADFLEIGRETISRIRNGKIDSPKITFLEKIVDKYKLSPTELYTLLTGKVHKEEDTQARNSEVTQLKIELKREKQLSSDLSATLKSITDAHVMTPKTEQQMKSEVVGDQRKSGVVAGNKHTKNSHDPP